MEGDPKQSDISFLAYRAQENAAAIRRLEEWRSVVDAQLSRLVVQNDTIKENMTGLKTEVASLKEGMEQGFRRVTTNGNRIMMAIAGGAITFAFSILAATGKI